MGDGRKGWLWTEPRSRPYPPQDERRLARVEKRLSIGHVAARLGIPALRLSRFELGEEMLEEEKVATYDLIIGREGVNDADGTDIG